MAEHRKKREPAALKHHQFKKGHKPWNKGKKGHKGSKRHKHD